VDVTEEQNRDDDHEVVVYYKSKVRVKEISLGLEVGFYNESIKRELKRRIIYEYQCDERLKTKNEESTRLGDTGLVVELEQRLRVFLFIMNQQSES
jgi:hypothetical protein